MAESFQVVKYWKRLVEERVITEEGIYARGQVPTDYGGSELTVKVVQRCVFIDTAGHVLELKMDDLSGVMDSAGNTGVGATGTFLTAPVAIAATGPSAHQVSWVEETNPALQPAELARAQQMYTLYLEQVDD